MQNDQKNSPSQQELDRFWDISALTPKPRRGQGIRRPESVETVEICSDDSTFGANASNKITLKPDAVRMSERAERSFSQFEREVKPSEPELEYVPDHVMIHRVKIFKKSGQYNYYEQFFDHANKIGGLKGNKCDRVEFFSYVPQFSQLTKPQLNWYLWWRECVWQGTYMPTDFSYILLYIYEIINTDGHKNPVWGQRQLLNLWREYRPLYPRLDRLLGEWICDFCLIHQLPPPDDEFVHRMSGALASCSMKEFYVGGLYGNKKGLAGAVMLTFCSNYNYKDSKFYKKDTASLYDEYIPGALNALFEYLNSQVQDDKLFKTETCRVMRDAFSGALCSFAIRKKLEIEYVSLLRSYDLRFMITDAIKYSENKVRAVIGIKSRLTVHSLTAPVRACIDKYFASVLPASKKEAEQAEYERLYDAPKTQLSPELAAMIEQTSWETTERLTAAFEGEAEPTVQASQPIPAIVAEPVIASAVETYYTADARVSLVEALSEYMEFLRLADACDFEGQRKYAAAHGQMIDLIIDKINEISVENFGDVILEEGDGGYVIIEDYRKEIFHD